MPKDFVRLARVLWEMRRNFVAGFLKLLGRIGLVSVLSLLFEVSNSVTVD